MGHLPKKLIVTDESVFMNRRKLLKLMGYGAFSLSFPTPKIFGLESKLGMLPGIPHPQYKASKELVPTEEKLIQSYNNFYEFSTQKDKVHQLVDKFETSPWEIEISGLVEKPIKLDVRELITQFHIEERVYRLRCVETWSAVVPWNGFPLKELIKKVQPRNSARYVYFETFNKPEQAPGMQQFGGPVWPYAEGLRMDEALHDLTLMANGMYGKDLPKQNGAPLRLVVPWKYGFKSIKSVVKIKFVSRRPETFWNLQAPSEYGFFANVNPEVSHPRWSQKFEKPLGSWFQKNPTLKFNGYGEKVAHLYKKMDLQHNY